MTLIRPDMVVLAMLNRHEGGVHHASLDEWELAGQDRSRIEDTEENAGYISVA